jgi:hypothetical protein
MYSPRSFSALLLGTAAFTLISTTTPAQAGLVIYYPLDEIAGNVAADQSGLGGFQDATATVANSNWQISGGIMGGALQFSPTAQTDVDEALIYNGTVLAGLPFSVSLWMRTTDTTAANHGTIYLGDATFDHYYAMGTSATHFPQQIARNNTPVFTVGPATINDGVWHHVTAVYSATNSRSLYIDGKLVGTNATNVPAVTLTRFGVGALTRSTQTDAFSGMLDEIGLFDSIQSPAEIALFNAFPRYDSVSLLDTDYIDALAVFNSQTGNVTTGTWTWSYGTGLGGTLGTTGLDGGGMPYVVLDASGNGLVAIPEPVAPSLCAFGSLLMLRRRRTPLAA